MSRVLKLVCGDFTLDLLNTSAEGISLAGGDDNWQPKEAEFVVEGIPPNLVEELSLLARGTSQNSLAKVLNQWNDMRQLVARYEARMPGDKPVWLHAKLANETSERRALVRRIDSAITSSGISDTINANYARIAAAIERHPYWEGTARTAFPESTASGLAVEVPYGTVGGNVPARIANFPFYIWYDNNGTPTTTALGKLWAGVRTYGEPVSLLGEKFSPTIEAEHYSYSPYSSSRAADSNASGGTKVLLPATIIDPGWVPRLYWQWEHLQANYSFDPHLQAGRFLWLMRAKVASGKWNARFHYRYSYDYSEGIRGPTVTISSSAWDYYEMGVQTVPLRDDHAHAETALMEDGAFQVELWAYATSGTASLEVDGIVMIPIEHGFMKIELAPTTGTAHEIWVSYSPEDTPEAVVVAPPPYFSVANRPVLEADNFYLPPGEGRIIVAYKRVVSATIGDSLTVGSALSGYYQRYLSLRGSA